MKKIFSLIAFLTVFAFNAQAAVVTVYKNLYATIAATPSGCGEVYIEAATDEDMQYVKEFSDDYGETAMIKATLASNGDEGQSGGINSGNPCFFVKVYAEPMEGYELAFYSNKIKEDGIYAPSDCYAVFNQIEGEGRTTSFTATGMGDIININNVITHAREDGTSADDTPTRDDAFANGQWDETPDAPVYAIFRKIGDELPKIDHTLGPDPGTGGNDIVDNVTTDISGWADAIYVEPVTTTPGGEVNLSIKMKNAASITAVEFQVEIAAEVATLETPVLSIARTSEARTNYFETTSGNSIKVVAFSTNNDVFEGNDGEIATLRIKALDTLTEGVYEIKVNNAVIATPEGVATEVGETKAGLIISTSDGIENAVVNKALTDKVYRVSGVEVENINQKGVYIKNGKTVLVK